MSGDCQFVACAGVQTWNCSSR